MAKFTFVLVNRATESGHFAPVIRALDVDCIESMGRGSAESNGFIRSSTEATDYLYAPAANGTLKEFLTTLGASFLTTADHSPIPAANLKWVFVAGFDSDNRPVWVNLARVKGFNSPYMFVGNDVYTLDGFDLTEVLRATGAGEVISTT